MRVLLDTHALLWWLAGDTRLSARARGVVTDEANEIHVSAASAWEIATKHRLGKLPEIGPLSVDFAREIARQGFTPLDIGIGHAQTAGALAWEHRDPFDRMLVTQAMVEKMALVSNDTVFDGLGVHRVW